MRQTWYFVAPNSKLREFVNLLHLLYTGVVLAFVIIGTALAPKIYLNRLLATILVYFLGLGIAAHALDQLEPNESHYVQYLTRTDLMPLKISSRRKG